MAIRPTLHVAEAKKKNLASYYNDNFDMMMDFIDASILEAKAYVNAFMPDVTGQSGKFLTNNGTTTSWGEVDLSGCADINLSNITSAAKQIISGSTAPDWDNAIDYEVNTTEKIMPGNGYLIVNVFADSPEYFLLTINDIVVAEGTWHGGQWASPITGTFVVLKDDVIKFSDGLHLANRYERICKFVPFVSEENGEE